MYISRTDCHRFLPALAHLRIVDKIRSDSRFLHLCSLTNSTLKAIHPFNMDRLTRWLVLTQNFTIRNQLRLAQSQRSCQSIRKFSVLEQEDFGTYNVILPAEPFVFGVNHIRPRVVPDNIVKPSYARSSSASPIDSIPLENSAKIKLGGEAELKIREAASLAKKVREFASTQVKVCVYIRGAPKS